MVANQKVTGRAVSVPVGLSMGLGVSLGVTLIVAALTAWMEGKDVIAESSVGYCAMIALLLSSLLGALTAAGKIKHRRLLMCLAASGCYFLSLIAVTALFFGGQYSGVGATAVVIVGGAAVAALIEGRGRKSSSVRKRKIKNR